MVWIVAQQHLYWGGFVLGSLLLVTLFEIGSLFTRSESSTRRLDGWAQEILRLILLGLSITTLLGGIFTFTLLLLYPDLTTYLFGIFRSSILIYGLLALGLTASVYLYFYSWDQMQIGGAKWIHASLGVLVNVIGTTLMMTSNAWSSFMLSPAGVDGSGHFLGNIWHVIHTATWNPMNIHRFVSHLVLGTAVIAAYSAYHAWTANKTEEKARYDWMSTQSFLVMIFTLFTIPFGGYWLMLKIGDYQLKMEITLNGGLLAWLALVRVLVVGGLFFGINYYLWQRIDVAVNGKRYSRYAKYVFFILALCFAVYITPHTIDMTPLEFKQMGGQQHPVLGNYGVESARNTAINLMIVMTIWSFVLWRLARNPNSESTPRWQKTFLTGFFVVGCVNLLCLGSYGFFIPANVRIGTLFSMPGTTLSLFVLALIFSPKKQRLIHKIPSDSEWGRLLTKGYFALFFIAFAVTWIVGLGGYLRSSVRLFWHVNEIVRDTSPWAFTHTAGFAVNVITLNALIFWTSLLFLFWLANLGTQRQPGHSSSKPNERFVQEKPVWTDPDLPSSTF